MVVADRVVSFLNPLFNLLNPKCRVGRLGHFRGEGFVSRVAGQDRMHLAKAAADGRNDGLTVGEQVGFFRFTGLRGRELIQRAR